MPLVTNELGVSANAAQQLLTVYLVALAVGQLLFGPVSDRYGRRPVLMTGACLYMAGALAAVFSTDISVLIAMRALQGLGAAACTAMSRAMVNDLYERNEAARQLSTIAIVLAVAPALSLVFGGWLAETTGWKGTMTVLAIAASSVWIMSFKMAEETNLKPSSSINIRSIAAAYQHLLGNWVFLCWTLASGPQVGVFFAMNGILGYQYQKNGYSLSEFGLWFALTPICYIIGNTINRKWLVSLGIERVALAGCVLSLLSTLALFLTQSLGMTHALTLALPCAFFGFGNGIVVANTIAGAISYAGEHVGAGAGIIGAWQMAAGGLSGAIIIALGGAQHFWIASSALICMALGSVLSMTYVYLKFSAGKRH